MLNEKLDMLDEKIETCSVAAGAIVLFAFSALSVMAVVSAYGPMGGRDASPDRLTFEIRSQPSGSPK
jgi:hypothetical protein